MNTTEILEEIQKQLVVLAEEHSKTTKIARKKARSAASAIKNLAADFKKTSTAEDKA